VVKVAAFFTGAALLILELMGVRLLHRPSAAP